VRVALGLAANDLLLPVVGAALLSLLGVTEWLGVGVRLLGLSYVAGWALLGVVLSLALVLGLPFTVVSIVLVAAALVAACAAAARARWFSLPPPPGPGAASPVASWATRIGAVLLGVGTLAALVTAVRGEWNPAADYDAFWFWLPRAETIFYAHQLDPSLWSQFAHAEYPPLMPVMTAMTFAFTGGFHPSLLPLQQALLGIAFLLAALALLDRFVPRWLSVPMLALLGTAPWFWGRLESPMPDQTLAYLIALAALACVLWLCEPCSAWLALGLLFLAAASLTKLEGTLSSAALTVAMIPAALLRYRRAGVRVCVLLLGPGAIVVWRAWLAVHGLRGSSRDYKLANLLDPAFLERRASRLHYSLHQMAVIADRLFGGALPLPALGSLGRLEIAALIAGLLALLILVALEAPAIAAALGLWLTLAYAGIAAIYWIGRPAIVSYVAVTVKRIEETPAMVTLTLTPLLLTVALRLVPAAARPEPSRLTRRGTSRRRGSAEPPPGRDVIT
jgi:hypothetical protein